MILRHIAARVAGVRTVSLERLLDKIKDVCPDKVPDDIGQFIGRGGQGEAYEAVGDDAVVKVGIAKDDAAAASLLSKVEKLSEMNQDVFPKILDWGLLCDVEMEGFRSSSGPAYFYVMEKLNPLPKDDAKRASRIMTDMADIHSANSGPKLEAEKKKYLFTRTKELKRDARLQNEADGTEEWDETNVDGGVTRKALDLFERMQRAGLIHRDMNASNIMTDADGNLKLIDMESTAFFKS